MRVLLISTYELGRPPFGLASPAAWLRNAGLDVACVDLAKRGLRDDDLRDVGFAAFHLPMHTATRLAGPVIERVRRFRLMPEPFSIESGTMTPTLKLKRQLIYQVHRNEFEGLYQGPQ